MWGSPAQLWFAAYHFRGRLSALASIVYRDEVGSSPAQGGQDIAYYSLATPQLSAAGTTVLCGLLNALMLLPM